MSNADYDVIIVGSGAGGGTLALQLAKAGKRTLLLERGDYLKRERDNWDSKAVFVDGKYQADETWFDHRGHAFHPGLHYVVGGNTKVYGSALFRLRERDFGEVVHSDGVSPAWPLPYDVFEPYYMRAEQLFHVHGQRGEDPCEPPSSGPYAYPPVAHEPRMQQLCEALERDGHRPFHQPLGVLLDEVGTRALPHSACVRCDAFDGFPCLTNGKADAQIICVDPARAYDNFTLMTGAYVERLETDPAGRTVTGVHVRHTNGEQAMYHGDIVVSACGALSSALLMFRSAGDKHPNGLANGSDQVGRNYMRHNNAAFLAVSRAPNDTVFQKTVAITDYYFGADDWEFPLGCIQTNGKSHGEQVEGEALPGFMQWFPSMPFDQIARHAMDFWVMSEDLPLPTNRITLARDGRVMLDVSPTGGEAHRRLSRKLEQLLTKVDAHPQLLTRSLYLGKNIPIGGTAHQAGTMRFGTDPAGSVLDLDCRAHELDNLYCVDAGFFPSIGAVNPTLTIIANALRVADHLIARLS